jgi:hypothetical protein
VKQLREIPSDYQPGNYYPTESQQRLAIVPNLDRLGGCPPWGLADKGNINHEPYKKQAIYRPPSEYKYVPLSNLIEGDLSDLELNTGDSVLTYGYVNAVERMAPDSCNCSGKYDNRRNTAIYLSDDPESSETIMSVITPRVKALGQANGLHFSTTSLKKHTGHWVRVAGILSTNANSKAWKIHPIVDVQRWEDEITVEEND